MKKLTTTCLGVVAGLVGSQADIIDFQSLEQVNSGVNYVGTSYTEDGWNITKDPGEPFDFAVWGTQAGFYPGSTALFNDTIGGMNRLEHGGLSVFNLVSIDLDMLVGNPTTVTFTGFIDGGGTVQEAFSTDGTIGLETFNFAAFNNLTKVEWLQDGSFHQYDNINVTVVPEPTVIVGLGLGLALLVARRRK